MSFAMKKTQRLRLHNKSLKKCGLTLASVKPKLTFLSDISFGLFEVVEYVERIDWQSHFSSSLPSFTSSSTYESSSLSES